MDLSTIDSLDKPDTVSFFGVQTGFETQDFAIGFGVPVATFVILTVMEVPPVVIFPLVLLLGATSLTLMFAAPTYLNVKEYLSTIRYYIKHKGVVDNTVKATVAEDVDGGMLSEFKTDETTREMTHIKRFYPEANVLERLDGYYVAALRIEPPNRDFDSGEDFAKVVAEIKENLNKNIDFPFQFHVTTRQFPIEDYINKLEDRLEDKDIQQKPIMKAILEEKVERRPDDLESRGTELPHYYLIAPVAPRSIDLERSGTQSPIEKMAELPIVGIVFEMLTTIRSDVEDHQREVRLVEKARNRIIRLNAAIVQPNEDFESRVVGAIEWSEVLHTFWTGDDRTGPHVRQQAAVGSPTDIPEISEQLLDNGGEAEGESQEHSVQEQNGRDASLNESPLEDDPLDSGSPVEDDSTEEVFND